MRKSLIIFVLLSVQCLFSQKTSDPTPKNETQSVSEAIGFIKEYYADFSMNYSAFGENTLLSDSYEPNFSGALFTLNYKTYQDDKATLHTTEIDFKKVISMEDLGYNYVQVYDPEGEYGIIISAKIGFKTKKEITPIYIRDEQDAKQSEIYKAFETVWKFYKKTNYNNLKNF